METATKTTNDGKWMIEDADGAKVLKYEIGPYEPLEFDSEAKAQEQIDAMSVDPMDSDAFPMKPVKKVKTEEKDKWVIVDADGERLDLGVASSLLEFDSEAEAQALIDDPSFDGDGFVFPMKPVKKWKEKWMIEDRELEDGDPGRVLTNSWNDDPRLWSSEAEAQAYIDSGVGGWFRPVKHDTRGIPMGPCYSDIAVQNVKLTATSLRRAGNLPATYKMVAKVSYTPRYQSWVTVAQMRSTTEGTTVVSFISVEGAGPVEITASEYRKHILHSIGVHPDRGGYDSY